ncbi:MAG TPA: hypothetical protein VN281_00070, partial [Verrucomicrobiae bacterium]|nr:hypothetical protein [Verrucomicrobiae bacterium]
NISPKAGSATAANWWLIEAAVSQISGPSLDDIIHSYEMRIDIGNFVPAPLPQLTQLATAFSNFGLASIPLGLWQCVPTTDVKTSTLSFDLFHRVDPPPFAFNAQLMAASMTPILFGPVLATPAQATPGGQITATGSNFPPSSFVSVGWSDTCTGNVVSSLVTVDPPILGSPFLIPRPANSRPIFMLPQVQPGQTYQVKVQDSDVLTTTQPSNAVSLQPIGELGLLLSYQSKGKRGVAGPPVQPAVPAGPASANLGATSVAVNGGFTSIVTIPVDAVPGSSATLYARVGQLPIASASFTIVGKLQPLIYLVAPGLPGNSTGAIQDPAVNAGYTVAVRGENFPVTSRSGPGNQVGPTTIALSINRSTQGALVGLGPNGSALKVQADGTFQASFVWPSGLFDGTLFVAGNYNLLVNKVYDGGLFNGITFEGVLATLAVTEEALLQ